MPSLFLDWSSSVLFCSSVLLTLITQKRQQRFPIEYECENDEYHYLSEVDLSSSRCSLLAPGLVLMRGALSPHLQQLITRSILEFGERDRKWWKKEKINKKEEWKLNNFRQGRGRIYDRMESFPCQDMLRKVCLESVRKARCLDKWMPDMIPTHLLVLFYTSARKLGWHRDNGAQDGQSDCPVVSISLGNSCDFSYILDDADDADAHSRATSTIRLDSGDILLFGGPSRHIQHSVRTVHMNTCSQDILDVHADVLSQCDSVPCEEYQNDPPSFRLNLTFRHAPELLGRENEERFYFFARSARKFLELARRVGVGEARRVANEARQAKHPKKKKVSTR